MITIHSFKTQHLLLRQWLPDDFAPFAALNADPEVMACFPALLGREESDNLALRCQSLIAEQGWGFWAAEYRATGEFIGFIGLHIPADNLPFSPCVEVGWRLARPWWGRGLATEGGLAALAFAFQTLALPEVVSFTTVGNTRSQAVMQRLGMSREPTTFFHPALPPDHPLSEHCLYRLGNPATSFCKDDKTAQI